MVSLRKISPAGDYIQIPKTLVNANGMVVHGSIWRYLRDEQERRKWQNPGRYLSEIGLGLGMTFANIGCGQGFIGLLPRR